MILRGHRLTVRAGRLCLLSGLLSGLIAPASAQDPSLLKGFSPTEDYVLEVNGEPDANAEIFYQQRIPAFLVLPTQLSSPVLLVQRTRQIQAVHIMKVTKTAEGFMDLAIDAVYANKGQFELEGGNPVFDLDGDRYVLKQRPPLLGATSAAALQAYSSSYVDFAKAYQPSGEALAALRREGRKVQVRIYFGSWCSVCKRYVPRMISVDQALNGSQIAIDYYGLPRDFSADSTTSRKDIKAVPTAVVSIDGREAGRITASQWQAPEKALRQILADS